MEVLIKTSQLLLSLSLLVIIHEFGHFAFARLFKTRVEKFYLFFNPWFSLFKFKKGDTEYGLGWLPLGGYVKISGMIDESMDKEQMQQPPQPHEFRTKKTWERLLIMLGGIIFNIIAAFFIYSMVLFTWGDRYLANENALYGITTDSVGEKMGLENGDIIVSIDGKPIDNFRQIPHDIIVNQAKFIVVNRNGQQKNIEIPNSIWPELIKNPNFVQLRIPFVILNVLDDSPASEAGLIANDQIIAINGNHVKFYDEIRDCLIKYKGQIGEFEILRNNDTLIKQINIPESAMLGVGIDTNPDSFFEMTEVNYGFFASFPHGVKRTFSTLSSYVKQFKLIFQPETKAYESLGGFISIGNIFPGQWDWYAFWMMTAFLSIILAFMNLLPIPALDGGHVIFLLYEVVTRRKPSDKFLEYAQITGFFLLIGLLLFANGNDVVKLFK